MTLYIACCEQLESKDGTRHSWTKAVWSFAKIGHREMPFYEAGWAWNFSSKCVWDFLVFKGFSRFKHTCNFISSVVVLRPSPALASSASQSSVPKLKNKDTRFTRSLRLAVCSFSFFFNAFLIFLCIIAACWKTRCAGSHRHGLELCHDKSQRSTGGCARPGRGRTPDTICSSDLRKRTKIFLTFFTFTSRISPACQTCYTCHASSVPSLSTISEFLSTTTGGSEKGGCQKENL